MINRRNMLGQTAATTLGVGLAACGSSSAHNNVPVFVFVHGAWHGSWCWAQVVDEMSKKGYPCVALDLPGHGVKAQFPAGYFASPQTGITTDVSPLNALTTINYRDYVLEVIRGLTAAGSGPVILVGHSLGGATITAVAETAPSLVRKLVYLTAFCPINHDVLHYIQSTEGASSGVPPLFQGNPTDIGAARLNPNSTDAAYQANAKSAFYADLTDAQTKAVFNLLSPDEPILALATNVTVSNANWGTVARAYIRCPADNAIPIALQDKMISEADAFTPGNRFVQKSLPAGTSHSPFISRPGDVADLLSTLT